MSIWPFNRKKRNQSVPAEVQQFYQAERRERVGLAWLLAFGTLVVTVLVVLGLFFGGRAIYRSFQDDTNKPATASNKSSSNSSDSSNNNGAAGSGSTPGQPAPNQAAPTPAPNNQPAPIPNTTPTTGEVPRTGPDEDL
jgi:cytoskeletal protein RodZ